MNKTNQTSALILSEAMPALAITATLATATVVNRTKLTSVPLASTTATSTLTAQTVPTTTASTNAPAITATKEMATNAHLSTLILVMLLTAIPWQLVNQALTVATLVFAHLATPAQASVATDAGISTSAIPTLTTVLQTLPA